MHCVNPVYSCVYCYKRCWNKSHYTHLVEWNIFHGRFVSPNSHQQLLLIFFSYSTTCKMRYSLRCLGIHVYPRSGFNEHKLKHNHFISWFILLIKCLISLKLNLEYNHSLITVLAVHQCLQHGRYPPGKIKLKQTICLCHL